MWSLRYEWKWIQFSYLNTLEYGIKFTTDKRIVWLFEKVCVWHEIKQGHGKATAGVHISKPIRIRHFFTSYCLLLFGEIMENW